MNSRDIKEAVWFSFINKMGARLSAAVETEIVS